MDIETRICAFCFSYAGLIVAPQIDVPPSERRALRVFRVAKDLNTLRLFSPLGSKASIHTDLVLGASSALLTQLRNALLLLVFAGLHKRRNAKRPPRGFIVKLYALHIVLACPGIMGEGGGIYAANPPVGA